MKQIGVLTAALTGGVVLLLASCGRTRDAAGPKEEPLIAAPARSIAALPHQHAVTRGEELLANDLEHGAGAQRVSVVRRWIGKGGSHSHFGKGWADENVDRLQLVDAETMTVLRGGAGWLVAHKQGQSFKTSSETEITPSAEGWLLRTKAGASMAFDKDGRLTSRSIGEQKFTYSYGEKARLTAIGSGEKNSLRYVYDDKGRVKQVDGPEGLRASYSYDADGRLAEVVSDAGTRTTYRYDDAGGLLSARDQFGSEIQTANLKQFAPQSARVESRATEQPKLKTDAFGRITELTSATGESARIEYNNLNLPVAIHSPGHGSERFSYNNQAMLVRREVSPSEWEEYRYDTNGRVAKIVRPGGAEDQLTYDERDQLVGIKTSGGAEVTYGYDLRGNVISETWSTGEKITRAYNANGQLSEITSASGLRTQFVYDAKGNLTETTDPVHGRTRYSDSADGRVIDRETLGKFTIRSTANGVPVSLLTPANQRTSFILNPDDLPAATLTADRLTTSYKYDGARRLSSIALPGGMEIVLKRDAAGRLTDIIRGEVVWRQFRHDDRGRVVELFSALGRGAKYEYGEDGRLTKIAQPAGELAIGYSSEGRGQSLKGKDFELEQEFGADGGLLRQHNKTANLDLKFPREPNGRASGVELNALKVSYGYDARGQIERITIPGDKAIQLTRDEAGRVTKATFAAAATMELAYDKADRITGIKAASPAGADFFNETYTFNVAGNVSEIKTPASSQRLEYDEVDRLQKVTGGKTPQQFRYDAGGNLSAAATRWVLDKLGRPIQQGPTTFTWDAGGNLTRAESALTRTEHTFDAAGRLTQRTREKAKWTYGYLPDGDRLFRESEKGRAWFAYTDKSLAAFKDEAGASWLIVNLPGTDWPLALCASNGQTYFVVADRLHSTRRIVDDRGNNIASIDFDPFGKIAQQTGSAPLLSYAGMVVDEGGLFYARQRYYDPALARFLSIDPLPGSPANPATHNAYSYALNNPHRYRDPTGTAAAWAEWLHHEHWDFEKWTTEELKMFYQQGAGEDMHGVLAHLEKRGELGQVMPEYKGPPRPRPVAIRVGAGAAAAGPRVNAQTVAGAAIELAPKSNAPTVAAEVAELATKNSAGTIVTPAAQGAARNKAITLVSEEGAELAARRGLPTMAVGAIETGSRLGRALTLLGRLGSLAGGIGDAILIAQNAHALATLAGAEQEVGESQAAAKAMRKALEEKIAETLRNNPGKVLPFPDGRTPDPNRPEDIDELLGQISSNLTNNRKPFEGIVNTSPDPEQQAALAAALVKARELIATGNARVAAARQLLRTIAESDPEVERGLAEARGSLAQQFESLQQLEGFPAAVENLKTNSALVQKQTAALRAAEAQFASALAACEKAEKQTCDFARQSPTAAEAQVKTWQSEASSLIYAASNTLNGAQEKIDNAALATEDLRTDVEVLAGFHNLQGRGEINAFGAAAKLAFSAAEQAWRKGVLARVDYPHILAQLREIPAQVRGLLLPFVWSLEAAPLIAEADDFATSAGDAPPETTHASELTDLGRLMKELEADEAKLSRRMPLNASREMVAQANSVISAAEAALTSARSMAGRPERYWPLQRASKCLAEIQFVKPAVAAASPTPSPSASASATVVAATSDEVTVPNLSGASPSEIESMLAHAGLKRSLVAAKEKPASKEKEFKFAGQTPAAGTKVKRGSTVAVAFYQKFEDTAAGSDEVTVPDLSVYANTSEMKAALAHGGLTGSFVAAKDKPASKEKEFKFAGQTPAAGTAVKRGSTVSVAFYQKFEDAVVSDETNVPDLSAYATTSEMKAALSHAGLTGSFVAAKEKPASKEKEFKLASQSPAPDTKVKRGSIVTVAFYQKYEPADSTAQSSGGVPGVIGLTLEQARDRLAAAGLQLVGTELGFVKAPSADDAYRVFAQEPAAGEPIPASKRVTVKQYGDAKTVASSSASSTPSVTPTPSATAASGFDPALLVGKWAAPNMQQCEYKADGTYRVGSAAPGRWRLEGSTLISDDPTWGRVVAQITSLTRTHFTARGTANTMTYTRVSEPPDASSERSSGSDDSRWVKHGPFSATTQGWTSTGIQLRKGQQFRVEASGKIAGEKGETLTPFDGVGHWRWRILGGKIGSVDKSLSGGETSAWADGVLELGVPKVPGSFEPTGFWSGAFQVYVSVKP